MGCWLLAVALLSSDCFIFLGGEAAQPDRLESTSLNSCIISCSCLFEDLFQGLYFPVERLQALCYLLPK